jgi:hypothetical protein
MLIQRSYLDLSPELRRAGARVVRERLRGALASPSLTKLQQDIIQKELMKIRAWEAGTLHLPAPKPPTTTNDPSDPLITVEEAEKLGLCRPGVLAWMQRRGVDPNVGAPASFCAQDENRRASIAGRKKLLEVRKLQK